MRNNGKENRECWKVVRDDGTVLGRYDNKPTAVAAAIRFSTDGCGYEVVNETIVTEAPAGSAPVLPMRGH